MAGAGQAAATGWRDQWPSTDFSRFSVALGEFTSGGPPKDGIPAIDDPRFVPVPEASDLSDRDPVIALRIGNDARAYPLRVMIWHEIANDRVDGVPVAVTYCPLCNAAIAFDRRVDGRELSFGVSGMLRHSDMVMYDRQTQSWWQQYSGEALVGAMTGTTLRPLPTRLESFARFKERHPSGRVLVPGARSSRPYGLNPYVGYEEAGAPLLYRGELPKGIAPLERVVVVENEAWTVALLQSRQRVVANDLVIEWLPGQASALDKPNIADGRDVGTILVQRRSGDRLVDVVHHVTFAFVLYAFQPNATVHTPAGDLKMAK